MAAFPSYTVEMVKRLPLVTYMALRREIPRVQRRHIADAAHAAAIARADDPGAAIRALLSEGSYDPAAAIQKQLNERI